MYVTSRVAECPYCSAHSCSFAMRRGASPEKVAQALVADAASFSRGELATIAVSAPAIVELICWLSVLQMLHRLSCFYVEFGDTATA